MQAARYGPVEVLDNRGAAQRSDRSRCGTIRPCVDVRSGADATHIAQQSLSSSFLPGDKDKQYAIRRESMSWPDDEDAVFVVSIEFHEPGSQNHHPSLRARTYARVRLPADVPNMRSGRAGFKLNRDWLHQPFGHWQERFGARLPAQTLSTGDPEVDKNWIITAADPTAATEALPDGVRRWLIDVAEHRTVTEARSEVEMETKDGWLLCDVGPTSLSMERRLEWLGWAKNAAQRLSAGTE